MRTPSSLDGIIPKTAQEVLALTLMHPQRWWYLSDLAQELSRTPSSLQKPLRALVKSGVLKRRQDGNRVYFRADSDCPFFVELQGLVAKTCGLVEVLEDALKARTKDIVVAFIYGSIARAEEHSSSDIDLMLIGNATRFQLTQPLRKAESSLSRTINLSLYTAQEFAKKLAANDRFLRAVLDKQMLFVVGGKDELEIASTRTTPRKRGRKQARA